MRTTTTFTWMCILLGFTTVLSQQDEDLKSKINQRLTEYMVQHRPEKTYIHTDKDIYIPGETIWYKAYLLDGIQHGRTDKSKVMHVELLNGNDSIVAKQKLYIEAVGVAGNFNIPETLVEGDYTLKAYTKYMLNETDPLAFSKAIAIWGSKSKITSKLEDVNRPENSMEIELRFFPEGGDLVYGLENTMGVKAVAKNGKGIPVSGRIVDEANKTVKQFETYEFGLGKFSYQPKPGKRYYAILTLPGQEKKYLLPTPMKEGHLLHIRNTREDLSVRIESNTETGIGNGVLVGHIRGRVFLNRTIQANAKNLIVKINKNKLQDGVAHFTLFTATGEPVCERLTFIDNPNHDNFLEIRSVEPTYQKRNRADITLDMGYTEEGSILGDFSVAVTSLSATKTKNKRTIESWLLLNSDIGGIIPDAGFFFDESNAKKRFLLDALMLTHGWRRFIWKKVLDDSEPKVLAYEPEKGIVIKGRTTAFKNKYQFRPSFVRFDVLGEKIFREKKATDPKGNFRFGPYVFQDTIKAMLQSEPMTVSKKELENQFKILIDETSKIKKEKIGYKPQDLSGLEQPVEYIEQASRKRSIDLKINPRTVKLKGVTVAARELTQKAKIEKRIKAITRYQLPNQRIFADSIFGLGSLQPIDLFRNIAGVRVAQNDLSVRGGGAPIFLLDGFQVERGDIGLINPNEIAVIDILKDANAAVFGPGLFGNAANGVIAIYTKSALGIATNSSGSFPNITNLVIEGFYKAREFYSPDYDSPKPEHKEPDYRTTLYWEPNVSVGGKGFTNLKFFTGDVAGNYEIVVEGISADGVPIRKVKTFEVVETID